MVSAVLGWGASVESGEPSIAIKDAAAASQDTQPRRPLRQLRRFETAAFTLREHCGVFSTETVKCLKEQVRAHCTPRLRLLPRARSTPFADAKRTFLYPHLCRAPSRTHMHCSSSISMARRRARRYGAITNSAGCASSTSSPPPRKSARPRQTHSANARATLSARRWSDRCCNVRPIISILAW